LVIDNVPDLVRAPELADRLRTLAGACRDHDVLLLTLGVRPVPDPVAQSFDQGVVRVLPAPYFTEAEVGEFLRAYGAPDEFLQAPRARFLRTLTAGHPVLLGAAALFLSSRGWEFRESVLSELLRGGHTGAVAEDVLQRLMASVSQHARELLYRLSLV